MRIALIGPVEETIPPIKYGGIEWIVYYLAIGLGNRGYEIDVYASADSKSENKYRVVPVVEKHLRGLRDIDDDNKVRESAKWLALGKTIQLIKETSYDIIHNHAGWRFLSISQHLSLPILTTHHMPLSYQYQNYVYNQFSHYPYISISNNQRKDNEKLNYVSTIYNGIDLKKFEFSENTGDKNDLFFLARMTYDKGIFDAVEVAKRTKKQFVVAAKVDTVDEDNYARFLRETKDCSWISYIQEIPHNERVKKLQSARALFVPIKWEEPFGLMFVESMACGTPVITYARGSAPEIIKDGVTGFLVNESDDDIRGDWCIKKTGLDGLCEAVERIYAMPDNEYRQMRKNCRTHVETNFTVERMVDEYEKVYQQILANIPS